MRLTVFAATGGVGRQLVAQAIAADHDVTAVARNPGKVSADVRMFPADLAAATLTELEPTLRGAEAALSCLGPTSTAEVGIVRRGTESIVKAMVATCVRRLVVVSAAPVSTTPSPGRPYPPKHDPGESFFQSHLLSPIVKAAFHKNYDDLARMEDVLRDSDLDWTVVRPPYLTNKRLTGRYRTAIGQNLRHGLSISRADVAHFMLRVLDQPDTIRQPVSIAY